MEKDNISDFTKMMNEQFKNILNPENQENFSFLDKKLLDYFNEFFESIQKNDVTRKVFKKKKRNIEKMFNYIKDLNNIVKERDLKKEKEKEKEEKKETKKYIINENIMPQIDDLIDESSDILLNMYRSMSENNSIEIFI